MVISYQNVFTAIGVELIRARKAGTIQAWAKAMRFCESLWLFFFHAGKMTSNLNYHIQVFESIIKDNQYRIAKRACVIKG